MIEQTETKHGCKKTNLGLSPQDWNIIPLQKLVRKTIRYGIVQTGPSVEDGVPCLRVVDMDSSGTKKEELITTSLDISNKFSDCILEVGDIAFGLRGDIGRVWLISSDFAGVNITRGIARISAKAGIDSNYLFYQLQSPQVKKNILLQVNGTSLKEIPIGGLKKISLAVPSKISEQRAIARILSVWDEGITTLQALILQKQARKKGLMQLLLSGKKRFEGCEGEWEEVLLGDVFRFLSTTSFSRNDLEYTNDSGRVRYIHYGDIHAKYQHIILPIKGNLDVPVIKEHIKFSANVELLQEGDLILADASEDYAGVADCVELAEVHDEMVIPGLHTFALRDKSGLTVKGIRGYLLKAVPVVKQIREIATGSKVYGISKTNIAKVKLYLPSKTKQQKIASVLSAADRELEKLEGQLAALQLQKKGLMQKLLTGEVRVKNTESYESKTL